MTDKTALVALAAKWHTPENPPLNIDQLRQAVRNGARVDCAKELCEALAGQPAVAVFYAPLGLIENCQAISSVQYRHRVIVSTEPEDAFPVPLYTTPPAASVDVEDALGRARHELRRASNAICRMSAVMPDGEMRADLRTASATVALAMEALDSAGGAKGECCVPDAGEPSFVFLGRDPQAPTLIEQWADERERAEPDSTKPAAARDIARRMREFKNANPDKGLPASAITPQPAEESVACPRCGAPCTTTEEGCVDPMLGDMRYAAYHYTRPSAAAVGAPAVVDDAMVERTCAALAGEVARRMPMFSDHKWPESYDADQRAECRTTARIALTAALAAPRAEQEGAGNG